MRKTLSVAVLVLAFCFPVSAGIIHNPAPAPQPTPASPVEEPKSDPTLNGEITNPGETQTGLSGSLAEVALDLLAVLPSLL